MLMPATRFTVRLLVVVVAVLLSAAHSVEAQEAYFPELVFLPKNKDVNSIIDDMTPVHLKAMKEPSLWKLSREDQRQQPSTGFYGCHRVSTTRFASVLPEPAGALPCMSPGMMGRRG